MNPSDQGRPNNLAGRYAWLGVPLGLLLCLLSFVPWILIPHGQGASINAVFGTAKLMTFVHLLLGLLGAMFSRYHFQTRTPHIDKLTPRRDVVVYLACQALMLSPFMYVFTWAAFDLITNFR
jgi:hypothetical protein